MINSKSIEVFLSIVEKGSISGVARSMHFSQPTVSEYLNQLEDALGTILVHRGKGQRCISLTPAGERFLNLARKWMEHQMVLEAQIQQFKREQQHNSLRLAASSGAHQLIVSNIVCKLIAGCSGINLQLCNLERREISAAIESSAFDIAFVFGKTPDSDLVTAVPICDEQQFILCPADTILPDRVITPSDLDPRFEVRYTGYKASEPFREWHSSCFPDSKVSAGELRFEVSSLGSIHHYLTDPRAWTIVPASVAMTTIAQRSEKMTFRHIEPKPPKRVCSILISKSYKEEKVIREFLQCCGAFIDECAYLNKLL